MEEQDKENSVVLLMKSVIQGLKTIFEDDSQE